MFAIRVGWRPAAFGRLSMFGKQQVCRLASVQQAQGGMSAACTSIACLLFRQGSNSRKEDAMMLNAFRANNERSRVLAAYEFANLGPRGGYAPMRRRPSMSKEHVLPPFLLSLLQDM